MHKKSLNFNNYFIVSVQIIKGFFLSALKELFLRDGLINENQMHTWYNLL